MPVKKVRAHSCFQRIKGVPQQKCNCRKRITAQQAADEVANGQAEYVIASFKFIEIEEACPICTTEKLIKFCSVCKNKGLIKLNKPIPVYGVDIIRPIAPRGRSPRGETIETAHIERSIEGNKADANRILLYGLSILENLVSLGAELRDKKTGKVLIPGHPEPEDDLKTGTGRRYDYGRSL